MIEVPIYNQSGDRVETLQVDEQRLGGHVRTALLKQALVMYHANQRQGTAKSLARGEVAGSTRKIYRQKGTGNARMGPIRNPVRKGGGHAKQRRPKDWRQSMPKKARRLARNSAILSKIQSNDIRVVDRITLEQPKTKFVAQIFRALGIDRSCLLALNGRDEMLERSARNIDRTTLTTVEQLNAWDILRNRTLVLTRDGLEQILNGTSNSRESDTADQVGENDQSGELVSGGIRQDAGEQTAAAGQTVGDAPDAATAEGAADTPATDAAPDQGEQSGERSPAM